MSEWKPGDVALIEVGCHANRHRAWFGGGGWYYGDDVQWVQNNPAIATARPLVVIDPEDREAVERLLTDYLTDYDGMKSVAQMEEVDCMQAALREFANPTPPIEEPTNLYAVVRDRGDHEWCHIGGQVWRSLSSTGQFMVEKHWHDNDSPLAGNVTAILSEGVTP